MIILFIKEYIQKVTELEQEDEIPKKKKWVFGGIFSAFLMLLWGIASYCLWGLGILDKMVDELAVVMISACVGSMLVTCRECSKEGDELLTYEKKKMELMIEVLANYEFEFDQIDSLIEAIKELDQEEKKKFQWVKELVQWIMKGSLLITFWGIIINKITEILPWDKLIILMVLAVQAQLNVILIIGIIKITVIDRFFGKQSKEYNRVIRDLRQVKIFKT